MCFMLCLKFKCLFKAFTFFKEFFSCLTNFYDYVLCVILFTFLKQLQQNRDTLFRNKNLGAFLVD